MNFKLSKPAEKLTFDILDLTDRDTLLQSLPKSYQAGIEIGVWQGWYTAKMIQYTSMKITAIDPWIATDSYEDADHRAPDFEPAKVGPDGLLWQEARYIYTINILNKFPRPRWDVLRSYSNRAVYFFEDNSLDFVYIDGEHSYEAVSDDIACWWPKVKSGGVMAGYDYNETNPGTKQAVNEFAKGNNLDFKITGTTIEKGDANAPSWVFIKE